MLGVEMTSEEAGILVGVGTCKGYLSARLGGLLAAAETCGRSEPNYELLW